MIERVWGARSVRALVAASVCVLALGATLSVADAQTAKPATAPAKAAAQPTRPKARTVAKAGGRSGLFAVWNAFQTTSTTGVKSAIDDPTPSAKGKAIIDDFRNQYDMKAIEAQYMDANNFCVEPGMPTVMSGVGGQPFEIIDGPKIITILSEVGNQYRRIFMDGEAPPSDGYPTTRNGWSNGHWEGDTLVVETQLIQEWLMPRMPHTDGARTVERIHLEPTDKIKITSGRFARDPKTLGKYVLVDDLTLIDPMLYDTPPQVSMYYNKLAGESDYLEQACPEGLWWNDIKKFRKSN